MGNSTTPHGRPISTIDDNLISSRYSKSVSTNHTLNPGNECIAASYSVIREGCPALVLAECIVWPSSHYQDLLQNISAWKSPRQSRTKSCRLCNKRRKKKSFNIHRFFFCESAGNPQQYITSLLVDFNIQEQIIKNTKISNFSFSRELTPRDICGLRTDHAMMQVIRYRYY